MHRYLPILFLSVVALCASAKDDMKLLQQWLNGVVKYDNEYPREKVFLHTDQQAYIHGETMWINAVVVRASSQLPQPVSHVLYVELLNTEGDIMQRQLLCIDNQGQAEGHIDLEDPIHSGFYELRAYTREMINWGPEALYRTVVPIFDERLDIALPDDDYPQHTDEPTDNGALKAEKTTTGYIISAGLGVDSMQLCALLVTSRERPCYVDTLTIGGEAGVVQVELDARALRDGWNCCYLMTTLGHSLGESWVWKEPAIQRELHVDIAQNKGTYKPFEPIAIEVTVRDAEGKPVPNAQFSMAVRDKDGLFLENRHNDILTELHQDRGGRRMPFHVMTGATPFRLLQPIEDKLMLQGHVYKDNNKLTPMPGINLFVSMRSPAGDVLKGDTRTDEEGQFAFTSNADFTGDWLAQISTTNDAGKHKWSRIALNRWFDIPARHWTQEDLTIKRLTPLTQAPPREPVLFQWEDTIPRVSKDILLAEAKVIGKGKYGGLKGDRHSYQGGEKRGMHFAEKFINVERALEQYKDKGGGNDKFQDFLTAYDPDFVYYEITYPNGNGIDDVPGLNFMYKGRPALVFIDNNLVTIDHNLYRSEITGMREAIGMSMANLQSEYWASEIKSVCTMTKQEQWKKFLNTKQREFIDDCTVRRGVPIEYAIFVYTRPSHYLYRGDKGIDKRIINGFQKPTPYPAPLYNGITPEDPEDYRRTLYWAPKLTTDSEGKASVVFFNGARDDAELSFSLCGITPRGYLINVEK